METLTTGNQEALEQPAAAKTVLEQKQAIYLFLDEILDLKNLQLAEGQRVRDLVTKDVRKQVRLKLFAGFRNGSIKLNKTKTDSQLKKYCSSVVGNWLDKDERYN